MKSLTERELLEVFKINPNGEITLLLGAGASISSDIPCGQDMIWDFKRKIYCRENNISETKFKDILCENNKNILQRYFDEEGVAPKRDSFNEYSYYFERCYPLPNERTQYITEKVRDKKPSIGYLCLGELIDKQVINKVFTTNFDELIEAGVHTVYPNLTISKFSNANIAKDNYNQTIPTIVSLHGDFKYDSIQNTNEELKKLEIKVTERCKQILQTGRLIVIGYAGNDDSIMSLLEQGLSNGLFPNGIIWCKKRGSEVNERVASFMGKACLENKNSAIAEIDGFDVLLYRIYRTKELINEIIEEQYNLKEGSNAPIIFNAKKVQNEFIKTNAFMQLEIPDKCLTFETDIKSWKDLNEIRKDNCIIAGLHNGKIISLSNEDTLLKVFTSHIKSKISETPFMPPILKDDNSVEMGLCYDILSYDLVNNKNLIKVGKRRFYDPNRISTDKKYYEAIEIRLTFVEQSICLTIIPTVELINSYTDKLDRQIEINSILGKRHNKENYQLLSDWRNCLYNKEEKCLKFEMQKCSLKFNAVPLSSGGIERDTSWKELSTFRFQEPKLCFSEERDADSYVNQLKGLIQNGPLSDSYSNMEQPDIQLAIFAPTKYANNIYKHLSKLNQRFEVKSDFGFLQNYVGFEKIFKRKINIPRYGEKYFYSYDFDPKTRNYGEFYNFVKNYINTNIHLDIFDVLIIFIPKEYKKFRELKNEETCFDLHDAIKLFCADKGIRVQIIEERSIVNNDMCKVMWGLSIGLFTKASGELWKPKAYNPNSAYIGISYALKRDGRHYLGCSQMFDSAGTGMRLQLQELYDPKFIGKNPYMRSGDAFKIVSELRNMYSKSVPTEKLSRVVIHKTTPFMKSEILGINQALIGIEDVELVQIQEYTNWRALLADSVNNKKSGAPYPFLRGTVMQIDNNSFLLWTHGSVKDDELNGAMKNYFKGGRGIPAPLLVRRFQGQSSGDELAREILMLSKMNLNSGDSLYKVLPVTIDFAKTIARMIKQQERQRNALYDFRYFM